MAPAKGPAVRKLRGAVRHHSSLRIKAVQEKASGSGQAFGDMRLVARARRRRLPGLPRNFATQMGLAEDPAFENLFARPVAILQASFKPRIERFLRKIGHPAGTKIAAPPRWEMLGLPFFAPPRGPSGSRSPRRRRAAMRNFEVRPRPAYAPTTSNAPEAIHADLRGYWFTQRQRNPRPFWQLETCQKCFLAPLETLLGTLLFLKDPT